MGFDPFLVELEARGHREEVAVLRGTLVEAGGRREEVGFDPFLVELEVGGHCEEVAVLRGTLVEAGDWVSIHFFWFFVDCGCGSMGFDLDRLGLSGFSF
nr:hypothetical protein CFP56_29711 [Quercus suber]